MDVCVCVFKRSMLIVPFVGPCEVGSILIAHPMSCIFQQELDRSVIVIDEVDPKGHVRGCLVPSTCRLCCCFSLFLRVLISPSMSLFDTGVAGC